MATFKSIERLCYNFDDLSEPELVSRLKADVGPGVLSERDVYGNTLLRLAAMRGRSPEFCQALHDMDATLVRTQDRFGFLPVHNACSGGNVETAKYLFELYPDSIDIAADDGRYLLHLVAADPDVVINRNEGLRLLSFLLKHDKGAVSTPDSLGDLPLHLACEWGHLAFAKLLFDTHPDGIFVQNNDGYTPMDIARSNNHADIVNFFEIQLEFNRQAQEDLEPDSNGQLPIHRVLQNENVSLGVIKLMVSAHRASLTVADNQGCIPLHLACHFGDLDIVKYLVKQHENSLTTVDSTGNLPLHLACLGGKSDIINYILKTTNHGVSVENKEGKLPIQIFLYDAVCARDLQHMDAFDSLLRADPISLLAIIIDEE